MYFIYYNNLFIKYTFNIIFHELYNQIYYKNPKGGDEMKKEIIGIFFLVFILMMLSSIYANSYLGQRNGNARSVEKCTSYNEDMCLRYSYTYQYQCVHYNPYGCSWRKVKFIDKCIIYKSGACKSY